ncbi:MULTISPECIES: hypothetical protein [Streptomycetaceae]|uniref:hypothetical protein n=1 Tax=Streptomycetaceae TaxID=2062 RepID=UPI0030099148
MSTAQDQQEPPVDPSSQVAVVVDSCARQDAAAVFAALQASFPSDRAADDAPEETEGEHPTVWSATFDVSRTLGLADPGRLTAPVTLTAQGGYLAVDRLREGLAEAFAVRVVGTAAGDQEQEAKLRLENR